MRPNCRISLTLPMPVTMVRNMMGAITILIMLMKVLAMGCMASPVLGKKAPTIAPNAMAIKTLKVRLL